MGLGQRWICQAAAPVIEACLEGLGTRLEAACRSAFACVPAHVLRDKPSVVPSWWRAHKYERQSRGVVVAVAAGGPLNWPLLPGCVGKQALCLLVYKQGPVPQRDSSPYVQIPTRVLVSDSSVGLQCRTLGIPFRNPYRWQLRTHSGPLRTADRARRSRPRARTRVCSMGELAAGRS